MRARGRVEAVSSGRTCWFALRRPVPLSDVVLTKLWGARGADCLLRIVGGQKFVLLLASWSSGSSGSPIVELLPRGLPDRRGHQLWSCCLVIFRIVGVTNCGVLCWSGMNEAA
jgi:hypothetical protein